MEFKKTELKLAIIFVFVILLLDVLGYLITLNVDVKDIRIYTTFFLILINFFGFIITMIINLVMGCFSMLGSVGFGSCMNNTELFITSAIISLIFWFFVGWIFGRIKSKRN
jgi:hypothetical protein